MTMSSKALMVSLQRPENATPRADQLAQGGMHHAAYARDLDEALKSAKSGIGHSSQQVFEWMDSWAAGDKPPLPSPDVDPLK
jgi:hypothetical protein